MVVKVMPLSTMLCCPRSAARLSGCPWRNEPIAALDVWQTYQSSLAETTSDVPSSEPTSQLRTPWINKRPLLCMPNESPQVLDACACRTKMDRLLAPVAACRRLAIDLAEERPRPASSTEPTSQLRTPWINKRLLQRMPNESPQGAAACAPDAKYQRLG